jgi:hypothetical protein
MRKTFVRRALSSLALTLTLTTACDDGFQTSRQPTTIPPRSVEDGLLFIEQNDDQVANTLLLDVASNKAHVTRRDLPAGSAQMLPRPGKNGREVIVFTGGRAAYKDDDGKHHELVPAHVLVFDRSGEIARHPLSGIFARLSLSEDGKYALAYQSSGFLAVQNAIEVVDIDKVAAKDASASQSVELLDGREIGSLVFSPAGKPDSFVRRLAIAPLPNALQIIDLEHPEKREISITLSETTTLTPGKIVFAKDQFFVQVVGSSQVLSFQYIPVQRGDHDFQLAPTNLNATSAVTDLATTGEGDKLRLLALSGKLDVLDPRIGTTAKVDAVTGFTQILQFTGSSPVDSNVTPRAALYAPGRAQIGFVDLGNESAWATRNVELIELGEPLTSLQAIPGKNLVLVRHASSKLSVVDLAARTVGRVSIDSSQAITLLDDDANHTRLWVSSGTGSLGSIDLVSRKANPPVALTFDAPQRGGGDEPDRAGVIDQPGNLYLVPRAGGASRRLAVLQRSDTGRVTFLDADNPVPATALEVLGFFIAGLLD